MSDLERSIPVPNIKDTLLNPDGSHHELTLENTVIVVHPEQYEAFDHLYIEEAEPVVMFNIKATPFFQYLLERGYSRRIDMYPRMATELGYLALQQAILEEELEHGLGHELGDDDEG